MCRSGPLLYSVSTVQYGTVEYNKASLVFAQVKSQSCVWEMACIASILFSSSLEMGVLDPTVSSLSLNIVHCPIMMVCSGWLSLSLMDSTAVCPLSFSLPRPPESPARLTSLSSRIASLFLMLPPQHTAIAIEDDAGNHRLVGQEFPADAKRPQPPQKVEPALRGQ